MNGLTRLLLGPVVILVAIVGLVTMEDDIPDTGVTAPDTYKNHEPLFAPRQIGQTFRAEEKNLSAIGFQLAPYTQVQPTGRVILHLRETPDTEDDLRTSTVPALAVLDDGEVRFPLHPPVPDSRDKTYAAILEYPDGGPDKAIGVRFRKSADEADLEPYEAGERIVDGERTDGDLSFRLYHRERPILGVFALGGLLIGGLMLLAPLLPLQRIRLTPEWWRFLLVLLGIPALAVIPLLRDLRTPGLEGWGPLSVLSPLSPHALAVRVAGPVIGTKVLAAAQVFIGMVGMATLLRARGRTRLASLTGAAIFTISSAITLHAAYGQLSFLGIAWFPWLVLCTRMSVSNTLARAGTFVTLGLLAVTSGNAITLGALLALALITPWSPTGKRVPASPAEAGRVGTKPVAPDGPATSDFAPRGASPSGLRRGDPPSGTTGTPVAWGEGWSTAPRLVAQHSRSAALLLGAMVLLAVSAFLTIQQRPHTAAVGIPNAPTLAIAREIFLDPRQVGFADKFPEQPLPWFELGAYVGVFPLALGALALIRDPRAAAPALRVGAVAASIVFLPAMHVFLTGTVGFQPAEVTRLLALVVFAIAALTARGVDVLRALIHTPEVTRSAWGARIREWAFRALIVIVIGDLLNVAAQTYGTAFTGNSAPVPAAVGPTTPTAWAGVLLCAGGIALAARHWTRRRPQGMLNARRV